MKAGMLGFNYEYFLHLIYRPHFNTITWTLDYTKRSDIGMFDTLLLCLLRTTSKYIDYQMTASDTGKWNRIHTISRSQRAYFPRDHSDDFACMLLQGMGSGFLLYRAGATKVYSVHGYKLSDEKRSLGGIFLSYSVCALLL